AGVCEDGTLLYAGTAANLASSLKNDNPFVDLVYSPDGNGLWGLDNDCGVWHAGTASSIGYGSSQGDCIRLAMYSSTAGVVIDSHGHLYPVNTDHDGGSQIHFDNGAVGGGYFPPFAGSEKDQFVLATDQTTVNQVTSVTTNNNELWANLNGGFYPRPTGTADAQSDLATGKFNIVDIASTPSGQGYWLLVNFRSELNFNPQNTVIAVGDARPAGGTQLGTVKPFSSTNSPVPAIRIISMPSLPWTDLYLDTITLPALYQSQLSIYSADYAYGQATGFFDMGYRYALYTPEWAVQSPGAAPTGLNLVIPLEYLSTLSYNSYIAVQLAFDYDAGSSNPWSFANGKYQAWQGSSAITPEDVSDVLDAAKSLTETLEEVLVDAEVISEGTLTPVVVGIEALIIAADIYAWASKIFGALSDGGQVNFPSVAAHAVVRTGSCLQPAPGPVLSPITSLSSGDGVSSFLETLGSLVDANPVAYGTAIDNDPNYNAWQYTVAVGSDGSLNPSSGTSSPVVFRVVQPEQSIAYNNGGCVVSTLITINEAGQFDTQCAVLCHFAKVQGTAPDGSSTEPLTLVGMAGGVSWVSLLGGSTVNTAIAPCILGNPNPSDQAQTLSTPQDILNAVNSMIAAGAQNQNNCPAYVGEGLGNFVVQTAQSFISCLGAEE
ncbi:MAG TPA: hypothetical protein VFR31_01590, partial [Thermoanaerobaculia bacterium]|nr:hypothetical protein [Thermoanaerobaculia bacterium]